jgi:Flp pilus assembly pilin Flp
MQSRFVSLIRDQRGANLVEYIIVLGFVALLAMAAFSKFGQGVEKKVGEQTGSLEKIRGAPEGL